jgi:AraC family transcriptional regulator
MLLRSLPDSSNPAFAQEFHAKWWRENCIIWGHARRAAFGPCAHSLSIRAAWGGAEYCHVNGRTLAVDDDNFLILNHGRFYSTRIRSIQPVESLAICFRPGLAECVYAAMAASMAQALSEGDAIAGQAAGFIENLQPHDRTVTPVLQYIRVHMARGFDDQVWYDEQLIFLLERLLAHSRRVAGRMDSLTLVRAATRREIFRRICLATDFLHTNYAQALDLDALAKIACLSKYHFLRLFTLVHGLTPFVYLQRKRTDVALRLLRSTKMTVDEVATQVGLATRSSLRRQLLRSIGHTPLQIRAQIA